MSIRVENLVKVYGDQRAVDDISFEVQKGQILGFLGPNGAGKSTTMKIATGFIPPTAGRVEVAGYDVQEKSLEVRQHVGYLPEHNPLYLDMYVHEYLHFLAQVHQLPKSVLKERIPQMIELCGLTREQNKAIGALSKGYRQRVGLAQALLHDPQVLILDEPTTGLDPNQIQEIRNLIKSISQDKTVIFSTHIMQEVQAICDRVIIINRGKIVADETVSGLQKGVDQKQVLSVELQGNVAIDKLESLAGVEMVEFDGQTKYRLTVDGNDKIRKDVVNLAATEEWDLISLQIEEKSLEHVFKQLTMTQA